jgi:colicin import membrane protein
MSDFNLVLFSDLTTNEKLAQLEAEGEKYQGLYVDMSKKDERKFVKDQASFVTDLLKKLDRKRIDLSKQYKAQVEAEAKEIKLRLEKANSPFTALIDEWNAERKRILDEEKRIQAEKELAEQIERDHEEALQLNRLWDLEKEDRERQREIERQQQAEREKQIAEQAAKQALINAENARQAQLQQEENARLKREADTEHKKKVNNSILAVLAENGISEQDAKTVITLAVKGLLPNTTINY